MSFKPNMTAEQAAEYIATHGAEAYLSRHQAERPLESPEESAENIRKRIDAAKAKLERDQKIAAEVRKRIEAEEAEAAEQAAQESAGDETPEED